MMYYTHLAFGFLIALLSIEFFDIKNKLIFILVVVMFSIFPDIDEKKSKIGKKYRWASTIINYIFGHRGFFHSIYIPLALYFIFYYINNEIGVAILAGYFSHLFMDALTKNGIRPLYPIINKKINGFIKTNSILEKILFLIIFLSILYSLLLIYLWKYILYKHWTCWNIEILSLQALKHLNSTLMTTGHSRTRYLNELVHNISVVWEII